MKLQESGVREINFASKTTKNILEAKGKSEMGKGGRCCHKVLPCPYNNQTQK